MSEKELKEKLDRLKASRGAHRGVITKRIGEVNTILEPEGTLNNEQAKQLDVLHRLLESKLKLVESLDESILSLCEVETIQAEIEDSERVLERVVACQKSIQDALTKRNNESSAQESQINPSQGSPGVAQQAKAKLPKLILPRFRGDVTKWTSFWDSYKTAVHESKAISTIDKFNYLNSLLEGPASRSIQGLSLTEANYNSAIEILHERFGKTQQIISAHMEELLKLPSCSTSERSNSLRFVYDKISVHIRGLSSLGVASDQYGGLLIPVVMSKLPNEIRVRIARETTSAVWKIEELMDVIKREVEAIEVSENVKITDDRNQKRPPAPPPKPRLPTAGTFFGATSQPEANVPKCVYCSGRHYSASCDKVTDINARRDILRRDKRCFMCLKRGHLVEHCDKSCRICKRRHHQSICQEKSPCDPPNSYTPTEEQGFSNRNNEEASGLGSATTTATSSTKGTKGSILLQTATAIATSEDGSKSIPVRILFDNGSQRSYVTDRIKAKLGLTATSTETLHLNTFGENAYRKQKCQVFTLPLRSSKDEFVEISALNFPVICSPLPKRIDVTKYPHLTDLDLADSPANEHDSIDILIGSDYYWDIVTGESIRGEFGPTAINSKFGWLLSGPTGEQHVHANSNVVSNLVISGEPVLNEVNQVDEITNLLKQFWETESIGIKGDLNSANHSPIEAKRNEEISFDGRHYEVSLPWKEDCLPRTNNYRMCETRLRSLHHKLKGEPNLLHEYDKIIQEQARTEIVERVPKLNDANKLNTKGIYYSPHHAVVRKDRETTKVRIVYDGSAKNSKEESSLNDCLEVGDNHIPHIFDMLTKFRRNAVGITADIEKAFLMVSIKKRERDMLRFLWFEDPFAKKPEIAEFRFNRLVFGLRLSPSILGATIKHHLHLYKQSEPEMAEMLEKSLYVDDLITGTETDEEAIDVYKKSKQIMADGGFNLRKWNSNSRTLVRAIENVENSNEAKSKQEITAEDDESYAKSSITPGNSETKSDTVVKVLGMNWDTVEDEFFFNFTDLYNYGMSLPATKRSVLKLTAMVFDPIGFLTPCTVEMKILFQELCLDKIDWDSNLPENLLGTWNSLLNELKCLNDVKIPRCYFRSRPVQFELHGFSDASHRAYAGVVYVRSLYENGEIDVRLVASKTRVAPLKRQTIPRLELLGALILARLMNSLNMTGSNVKTICWTDSMTTLCWIKNERTWKQYVQHRVEEIRNLTSKDDWRHCPGELNPADIPSRGLSAKELSTKTTWWNGAAFLYQPESEWPENRSTQAEDKVALEEAVKNPLAITHSLVNNSDDNSVPEKRIDQIIDIKRFHDLTDLLRVTALVVKIARKWKNRIRNEGTRGEETSLNAADLKEAENLWIKSVQATSFAKEIEFLKRKDQKSTPPTYVTQFGLYIQEGIVKCKGRMNNANLPGSTRNPILLPAKHEFVQLIIKKGHESVKHCGLRDTLTTLRERFWILRGREAVKRVIKKCVICLRINGMPYKAQSTPDLPSERVSDDPPFTHVGLDFAGPLNIVNEHANESSKVYVCLFTCASTRAVHLELCKSLDVQDFLLAFRRFASRRGLPATINSDNAKTFKSSSKEIRRITRSNEVLRYLVNQRVTWNFIVEKAPWWGGFWERLVRSVKLPLKKVLGRSSLSFEQLRTLMVEIESVINARPITYVYDDANSISYPLSPSDLVYGRRVTLTPNDAHYEIVSTHQSLTRRAKHHKNLLQQVTKQWRKEYLTSLREQSSPRNKGISVQEISVGDIVLLKNDSTNRIHWKIARVEELIPGADGKVRAAIVKVGNSDKRPSYLRRVIQHLIPIEVKSSTNNVDTRHVADVSSQLADAVRPRRTAAVIGEIGRRQMNIV